jgi:hypothetical protein
LVLGPTTGDRSLATADAVLIGEVEADLAGYSVALVHDTDGDGAPDLLAGAMGAMTSAPIAGKACLALGYPAGAVSLADSRPPDMVPENWL